MSNAIESLKTKEAKRRKARFYIYKLLFIFFMLAKCSKKNLLFSGHQEFKC